MELLTKCYSCGGEILFPAGKDVVRCEYCTRFNDRPKSEKQETDLMKYANERRNLGDFDKAEEAYDKVLQKNLGEHEARWGILLCKRGVVYLKDEVTGESVITCRRIASGSLIADPDFRKACEDAPLQVRRQYERDAEYIDAIQRAVHELAYAEPYDVFICYKETEPGTGERTEDSKRALNVYQTLTRRGYNTFYAPVSLKNHLGANYEAAIYHAIQTAQVMIVLGTNPDYFETTWMQSEWRRFLDLIDSGERKLLIPLYQGFPPNLLPDEFSHRFIQGLDMSDMGCMFDLENMLDKVIRREKPEETESDEMRRLREEYERIMAEMERINREKEAAEAVHKAEEEGETAEAVRKAEEEHKSAEAARKAEEERKAAEVKPMHYSQEEFANIDWDATLGEVAQKSHVKDGEILDSWEQIFEAIDTGIYKKIYKIGDRKLLDLGPEGQVHMQIAAFDVDDRADGSGKAPITWISEEALKTRRRMNPELQRGRSFIFMEDLSGTGGVGGWVYCELREVLEREILPLVPKTVAGRILTVQKRQAADSGNGLLRTSWTEDRLWIPSSFELKVAKVSRDFFLHDGFDRIRRTIDIYGRLFDSWKKYNKHRAGTSEEIAWWLRSGVCKRTNENANRVFEQIDAKGAISVDYAQNLAGIVLGFCT